jgi:hypothetical protein
MSDLQTTVREMLASLGRDPHLHAGNKPQGKSSPVHLDASAPHDPVLAIIDSCATVLDVLKFYNERIADEGFLSTASERQSVQEMAQLVGYEPSPGVAAETWLAYIVEAGQTAISIPAGTRAQSVPARPDETPQTFETSEPLLASARWNHLTVQTRAPSPFAPADSGIMNCFVQGVVGQLRSGRPVLTWTGESRVGGKTVVTYMVRDLQAAAPQPAIGHTMLRLGPPRELAPAGKMSPDETWIERWFGWIERHWGLGSPPPPPVLSKEGSKLRKPPPFDKDHGLEMFQVACGLFGQTAAKRPIAFNFFKNTKQLVRRRHHTSNTDRIGFRSNVIYLDNVYDIAVGTHVIIIIPRTQPRDQTSGKTAGQQGKSKRPEPPAMHLDSDDAPLAVVAEVVEAGTAVRADYDLAARVTRLKIKSLDSDNQTPLAALSEFDRLDGWRSVAIYASPTRLELADREPRDPPDIQGSAIEVDVPYAELHGDLHPPRTIIVSGAVKVELTDLKDPRNVNPIHFEPANVIAVEPSTSGDFKVSRLILERALRHTFLRPLFNILGNVVHATHGETVRQSLGSGDGSANQSFRLRQKPVVHVSAPTANGAACTLEVRVNGVHWHDAGEDMTIAGPTSHVYTVSVDSVSGAAVVQFGDGVHGARVPSGADNVTAIYRVAQTGLGNLAAGQITNAIDRPMGVKSVTNPLPATGGIGRESGESIRRNIARWTQLFDRLVSAADYERFALTFAGVTKAKAIAVKTFAAEGVVDLVVAGATNEPLDPAGHLFVNLRAAMARFGDPRFTVKLTPHTRSALQLTAAIQIDPDFQWDSVAADVRAAVFQTFGYMARDVGAAFDKSPLVACIQAVGGVNAVRITCLALADMTPDTTVPDRIQASASGLLCFDPGVPDSIRLDSWTETDSKATS